MSLLFLALGGWAFAMVLVLGLFTMSSREDRAACIEQAEVAVRSQNRLRGFLVPVEGVEPVQAKNRVVSIVQ